MLTRGMCVELARYNIQVNGIAPGYFKTEMTQALADDPAFTAWLTQRTPAARWGDPQELIGAAVFWPPTPPPSSTGSCCLSMAACRRRCNLFFVES